MQRDDLTLPDFIIGGAPRSGTTWLYHLLDRHPDVWMAKPVVPEPKFFLVDDIYERGLRHYSATWFEDAPARGLVGEKSSNYLESHMALERIRRDLPDVRMIFALREPARRALSNYRWSRMNQMESATFSEALRQEREREATQPAHLRFARPHAYFSRGLYAQLLRPWFQHLSRHQILVVLFEDIVERPRDVAARVHAFLDLATRPDDATSLGRINASVDDEKDHGAELARLRADYDRPNQELEELLGERLTAWEHH